MPSRSRYADAAPEPRKQRVPRRNYERLPLRRRGLRMPDGRRRRAAFDSSGSLPGDARKRRRERQRRDARRTRAGIGVFVVVGTIVFGLLLGLAATAAFIDHLPKLAHLGPVELGENSRVYARDCTRSSCTDVELG